MYQSAPAEDITAADNPLASSENFTELFQEADFEFSDISDVAHGLPSAESILTPHL